MKKESYGAKVAREERRHREETTSKWIMSGPPRATRPASLTPKQCAKLDSLSVAMDDAGLTKHQP